MTLYEKIKTCWDQNDLAHFITTLINETEDKMLYKLAEYGIEASIARPSYELQVTNNLAMLMEDSDDAYSKNT